MADETLKSILVVDDTPTNIDILMEVLSADYDVQVATDGEGALESVTESIPHLILLDIMMPGMDGYEVCKKLKQNKATQDIPIIFITAMSQIEDEVKGFEAGAIDFITKPFSPPIVKHRVSTALQLADKNKQLATLAQKLSKYLSPQIYVSIFRGDQDAAIGSKRKKLTIFFSDIVNFTSTTEGMETEDLTELLNSYLDRMSKIALKYGGTIDKFIGDALLIFFGDPLSRGEQEDAVACVSMAIEMRDQLSELQKEWYSYGIQNPFKVRIGISTGFCTVGNFGSKNRMDYTIIGTQVNTASRLESSAEPDQILLSHETYSLVKDKITCLKNGLITVKGINRPIQTYLATKIKAKKGGKKGPGLTAGQLVEKIEVIEQTSSIKDAYLLLDNKEENIPLVVTDKGIPVGIITKSLITEHIKDEIPAAVYIEQNISVLQIKSILVVDKEWPLEEIKKSFLKRSKSGLYDPVIVKDDDKVIGMIPAYKLIKNLIK